MTNNISNLSDIANSEMKSFALYTITDRAIPNLFDGLKPVQRFYLYSSFLNTPRDFKKVSAVAGIVSDYGYNHGESSAASAGQLMAATWNNNVCLIEGRGSFGTRLVPKLSAPRYVYTKLHYNFHKFIHDIDLSPSHEDPEHTPPKFYIPTVPLVLINGAKGIATGFATHILPHSLEGIKNACMEYINTGKIEKRIKVSFPDFKGSTSYDKTTGKHCVRGTFKRISKTQINITEVPYGYDRVTYIDVLDKLEENGKIVSYVDKCSVHGFQFNVKLKQATVESLNTDEAIITLFRLEKKYTENITVINQDGKMVYFEDERELIKAFVDYRNDILKRRIQQRLSELQQESEWLKLKLRFIELVLEESITFKNQTKANVVEQIRRLLSIDESELINSLLKINLLSITLEQVNILKFKINECKEFINWWMSETPKTQFINDLNEL